MKLIITIPKEKYSYIQELEQDNTDYATTRMLYHAVKHGKPYLKQESETGRWIPKDGKEQGYDIAGIKTWYIQIICDKCGFIKTAIEGHTGQYKFCPNCGARMESEDKE